MEIRNILQEAVENDTSDIFIIAGLPLTYKIHGKQLRVEEEGRLLPDKTEDLIRQLYDLAKRRCRTFSCKYLPSAQLTRSSYSCDQVWYSGL